MRARARRGVWARGGYAQLGWVVADRLEPVARYAVPLPEGEDADQHDVTAGLDALFHGDAPKWQTLVGVRLQQRDGGDTRDLSLQSRLSLAP
jgi:hypothetical protein